MKPFISLSYRRVISFVLIWAFLCLELLAPLASAHVSDSLRPRNFLKRVYVLDKSFSMAADGGKRSPYIGATAQAIEAARLKTQINQMNRELFGLIGRVESETIDHDLRQFTAKLEALLGVLEEGPSFFPDLVVYRGRKLRLQHRIHRLYAEIEGTYQKFQGLQQKSDPKSRRNLRTLVGKLERLNQEQQKKLRTLTILQLKYALLFLEPGASFPFNRFTAAASSLVGARNNLGRILREIRWSESRKHRQAFLGEFNILEDVGGEVKIWTVLYIDGDKREFLDYLRWQLDGPEGLHRLSPAGFYQNGKGALYARLERHFESQGGYAYVYKAWQKEIGEIVGHPLPFQDIPKDAMPEKDLTRYLRALPEPYLPPAIRVRRQVSYGSLSKLAHRPIHVLLTQQDDYNAVLDAVTRLEDIAVQLTEERPSKRMLRVIREDLEQMYAWTLRGKKEAKRDASSEIAQALALIGDDADPESLRQAAHFLTMAIQGTEREPRLRERLTELEALEKKQEREKETFLFLLRQELFIQEAREAYRAILDKDDRTALAHLRNMKESPLLTKRGERAAWTRVDIRLGHLVTWLQDPGQITSVIRRVMLSSLEHLVKYDLKELASLYTAQDGGKEEKKTQKELAVEAVGLEVSRWYAQALLEFHKKDTFPSADKFPILDRWAKAILFGWMTYPEARKHLRDFVADSRYTTVLWNKIDAALVQLRKSAPPSEAAMHVVPLLVELEKTQSAIRTMEEMRRSERIKRKKELAQAIARVRTLVAELQQTITQDPAAKDFLTRQVVMEEEIALSLSRYGSPLFVAALEEHAPQVVLKGRDPETQGTVIYRLLSHPDLRVVDATVDYLFHQPFDSLRDLAVDFLEMPVLVTTAPAMEEADKRIERWVTSHRRRFKRGQTVRDVDTFKWFLYMAPYPLWKSMMRNLIRLGTGRDKQKGGIFLTVAREEAAAFLPALRVYLDRLVGHPLSQVYPGITTEATYFTLFTPLQEDIARYKLVKQAILALENIPSAADGGAKVAIDKSDDDVDLSSLNLLKTFREISALEARIVKFHNIRALSAFTDETIEISRDEFIRTIQAIEDTNPAALMGELEEDLRTQIESSGHYTGRGAEGLAKLEDDLQALRHGILLLYQRVQQDIVVVHLWEPVEEGRFQLLPRHGRQELAEGETYLLKTGNSYFKITPQVIVRMNPVTGTEWGMETVLPPEGGVLYGRAMRILDAGDHVVVLPQGVFDPVDPLMSRWHFTLAQHEERRYLTDLGSKNGTFYKVLKESSDGGFRHHTYTRHLAQLQGREELLDRIYLDLEQAIQKANQLPEHPFYTPDYFKRRVLVDLMEGLNLLALKGRLPDLADRYHALSFQKDPFVHPGYRRDNPFAGWLLNSRDPDLTKLVHIFSLLFKLNRPATEPFAFLEEPGYLPALKPLQEDQVERRHWVRAQRKAARETLIPAARGFYEKQQIPWSAALEEATVRAINRFLDNSGEWDKLGVDTDQRLGEEIHLIVEKYLGVRDPMQDEKDQADAHALTLFPAVWQTIDSQKTRTQKLQAALAGSFVGNLFDVTGPDFDSSSTGAFVERLVADFEHRAEHLVKHPEKLYFNEFDPLVRYLEQIQSKGTVVIAFDNAGPDFILGVLPLAMVLAQEFHLEVVLAGNENPAYNDKTWYEAATVFDQLQPIGADEAMAEAGAMLWDLLGSHSQHGKIRIVSTGNNSQRMDLRRISRAFNEEADLFIFQGQARGIESVRHAGHGTRTTHFSRFTKPVVFLATVKDPFTMRGFRYEIGRPTAPDPKAGDMILIFRQGFAPDGGRKLFQLERPSYFLLPSRSP